jgi:hypothetical protein
LQTNLGYIGGPCLKKKGRKEKKEGNKAGRKGKREGEENGERGRKEEGREGGMEE